jgi:hypothetical protein
MLRNYVTCISIVINILLWLMKYLFVLTININLIQLNCEIFSIWVEQFSIIIIMAIRVEIFNHPYLS